MKSTALGQNIKLLRKRSGLSQRELAERLGLKRNNIASYEAGIVEPSAINFIAIAQFFEVDAVVLLSSSVERDGTPLAPPSESPTGPGSATGPKNPKDDQKVRALIEELQEFYRGQENSGTETDSGPNREIETMLATLTKILSQPE